ncbi:hypothetical protein BDN71DRAFT_1430846 [Pleurotus eryngii]|uniref:Uncharacterized protein n=1 Tax=Pleurotus eryngii TaxID=5323 RepID=A0A9P5ZXT0_PLEER|nr:hypothetical protein BDN71DRAFT_1430846 [Pleurotus eryngii]
MAPPSRCNAKQKEFLLKHVSGFLKAQKKGRLDKFWVIVNARWFQKWKVVKDAAIVDVEERQKAYGKEVVFTSGASTKTTVLHKIDHILPHVKTKVARLTLLNGKKPTHGWRLCLVRNSAAKYFDNEPEEIKDQMMEVYEKCKDEVNKKEEEASKSLQASAAYIA